MKDEIFDMVTPKDPLKITLADLLKSGQGETVFNILTDLNGFWSYENREVLVSDNQDGMEGSLWQEEGDEIVIWSQFFTNISHVQYISFKNIDF